MVSAPRAKSVCSWCSVEMFFFEIPSGWKPRKKYSCNRFFLGFFSRDLKYFFREVTIRLIHRDWHNLKWYSRQAVNGRQTRQLNVSEPQTKLKPTIFLNFSSASNRIIHAKDHASVQVNVADVDPATGIMTSTSKVYAICGAIRMMGESDDCIARLAKKDGLLAK